MNKTYRKLEANEVVEATDHWSFNMKDDINEEPNGFIGIGTTHPYFGTADGGPPLDWRGKTVEALQMCGLVFRREVQP